MIGRCPLFSRAATYTGMALVNSSWLQDNVDILLVTDLEICLTTAGGWLDRTLIYRGSLLGFLYVQCLPDVRSIVISRKSVLV